MSGFIWLSDVMSSVGVAQHSIGHREFAPPPLTEQFTVLLNLNSNIKHLLDGLLEAVEVVVNQSFPLKAFLAEEADHREELGDLLQVHHCSVVQVDDGHRLLVIG